MLLRPGFEGQATCQTTFHLCQFLAKAILYHNIVFSYFKQAFLFALPGVQSMSLSWLQLHSTMLVTKNMPFSVKCLCISNSVHFLFMLVVILFVYSEVRVIYQELTWNREQYGIGIGPLAHNVAAKSSLPGHDPPFRAYTIAYLKAA